MSLANVDKSSTKQRTKIGWYSARVEGVHHILKLENDSLFSLYIFPKHWLSCWQIVDYSGIYKLNNDTLRFTFQMNRMSNEFHETEAEIVQETFVVKRNENIYRIGKEKLLHPKYRFSWHRYRSIDFW